MDDFLPAYAKVIDEVCPCAASDFESLFNNAFMRYLPESERVKKTLDNTQNFLKIMTNLPFLRIFATRCNFLMARKK